MNIRTFRCADCGFCQSALVPDYTKGHVPGVGRPRIRGLVCGIRPPVAGAGAARPITYLHQLCALWTSVDGDQPLRHLLDHGESKPAKDDGGEA